MQKDDPFIADIVPGLHIKQVPLPSTGEKNPAAHFVHTSAPIVDVYPAGQASHFNEFFVPDCLYPALHVQVRDPLL